MARRLKTKQVLTEPEIITGSDFREAVQVVVNAANAMKDKPESDILIKGCLELSRCLKVSPMTIYRWEKAGLIKEDARIGRIKYFNLKKVKEALNII